MNNQLSQQLLAQEIQQMTRLALAEDLADINLYGNIFSSDTSDFVAKRDITAELVEKNKSAKATLITREAGILCGIKWVETIFQLLGGRVALHWHFQDGDTFKPGEILCTLTGNARDLLTGERSAMNFLQTLSATATQTNIYVTAIKHTQCKLLDTRKTIPGMRFGQKYAVKCGGGNNHRLGLSDAFLIKENHILACGGIAQALAKATKNHPDKQLEIEVESLKELSLALDNHAQVIMLDNFSIEMMHDAITIRNNHHNNAKLEASGNLKLDSLIHVAQTGIDFISVGALTKNIRAIDLSMRIDIT